MELSKRQQKSYRHDSRATLVKCGPEYFEVLHKMIEEAESIIQFHTYIFDHDDTGKQVIEALKRAVARGVKVFLVVDSYGSASLSKAVTAEIKNAGIRFRRFSPFFSKSGLQVGRRLHHKIVVTDEERALIGGINIADKYRGTDKEPPWLDFAVMLEGNVCKEISGLCRNIEEKKISRHLRVNHHPPLPPDGHQLIRMRRNDWIRRRSQIRDSYKYAIRNAQESITIVASYFIPGITLRRTLRKAAQRGVKINLLLSEQSDVPFIKSAHRFLYGWLLHINVRVFEYKPSIVHGKAMVVDKEWATIGSYNLNHLSDYSSIELNADILSKDFAAHFNNYLEEILKQDSTEITDKMTPKRWGLPHLMDWFSYQFVRLNMSLLFFFITKRGRNNLE